jgi:hypothetical protein
VRPSYIYDAWFLKVKFINLLSISNMKEFPEEWAGSIIVPIYKKNDKTDCSNCRGISLLSTNYKMLSNIWPSRLTPFAEEIFGNHQCKLRRNA